jgi:endonuclease YncB( thermonuclease family)
MKKILLMALLAFPLVANANPYNWKALRAVDGDTVEVEAKWLPIELGTKIKIRVLGVDTPEKAPRAKCEQEATKAILASAFTKDFIKSGKVVQVNIKDWDKYGGRILGDIVVDGKSLKDQLILRGHARVYNGGAKSSWCN